VIRVSHPRSSHHPSPLNQPDEHHDNGNHQQDMDYPAHRVTAHQTEQPQSQQYHSNRLQHCFSLFIGSPLCRLRHATPSAGRLLWGETLPCARGGVCLGVGWITGGGEDLRSAATKPRGRFGAGAPARSCQRKSSIGSSGRATGRSFLKRAEHCLQQIGGAGSGLFMANSQFECPENLVGPSLPWWCFWAK
jgi:hypothetical protein